MPGIRQATKYRLTTPAKAFYAWLIGQRLDVSDTRVDIAIAQGRYEPDDDPRDIGPHTVPAGTHKPHKQIGGLTYDLGRPRPESQARARGIEPTSLDKTVSR